VCNTEGVNSTVITINFTCWFILILNLVSILSWRKSKDWRNVNKNADENKWTYDYRASSFIYCSLHLKIPLGWLVDIALRYGLDNRGSRVRLPVGARNSLFTTASRTVLGPTQPPIQWVPGTLSLEVKRPGLEADHSPPSSTEVREWVELYIHFPSTPSWRGAQSTGTNLHFTFSCIIYAAVIGIHERRLYCLSMKQLEYACGKWERTK
jgi:hypothetical protein